MEKKDVIQIRVSEEWKEKVTEEAKKVHESPSEYIRKAVEQRIANESIS